MAKTRRTFSPEEKVRILRQHLIEGVSVADVCDRHGLRPTVLYRWQKESFESLLLPWFCQPDSQWLLQQCPLVGEEVVFVLLVEGEDGALRVEWQAKPVCRGRSKEGGPDPSPEVLSPVDEAGVAPGAVVAGGAVAGVGYDEEQVLAGAGLDGCVQAPPALAAAAELRAAGNEGARVVFGE